MAWANKGANGLNMFEETKTLPGSATTGYSTEIDFLKISRDTNNKYVSLLVNCSAVSGTNVDIALYGAMTSGGDKFLLLDAVVADVTTGVVKGGVFDLNAYPAPYYYIAYTTDADEDANTITMTVFAS